MSRRVSFAIAEEKSDVFIGPWPNVGIEVLPYGLLIRGASRDIDSRWRWM